MASSNSDGTSSKSRDALVSQFCAITGASQQVGEQMLEACAGNLEMALEMHLDSGSSGGAGADPVVGASDSAYAPPEPDDNVRAPIPQRQEVLVEDHIPGVRSLSGLRRAAAARSVFDGFRDFQAEARQQEMVGLPGEHRSKKKTLEDLFRPPIDLLHKGSFHSARDVGSSQNRWLLVNIQDVKEFACQMLNRDVWSHQAVKGIIGEHFVFWQVYRDSEEGKKYMQFYKVLEWPYIAILDPQTGENMVTWNKVDAVTFCDLVTNFLISHPTPDGSSESPPKKRVKRESESIVDASEDSQIEAAIRASLESRPKTVAEISDESSDDDEELETFSDSDDDANGLPDEKPALPVKSNSVKKGQMNKSSKHKQSNPANTHKPEPVVNIDENTQSSLRSNNSTPLCDKYISDVAATNSSDTSATSTSVSDVTSRGAEGESRPCGWKQYLGPDSDEHTELVLRFPNGKRKKWSIPNTSKLMALVQFVVEEGYSNERYELVTTFPRRKLSFMDFEDTLKKAGLQRQETVFVQER